MENISLALCAHVDAGKTTLSEAMLFEAGAIRKKGRVDHGDAFLDTDPIERERGITIFSKLAIMELGERRFTLMDTPGHVDFSAEAERTLAVADGAVLVVSATEPVQGHTRTLWGVLRRFDVPTVIFVNKMDLPGADRAKIMRTLSEGLSPACADFGEDVYEATVTLNGKSCSDTKSVPFRLTPTQPAFNTLYLDPEENKTVAELIDFCVNFGDDYLPEYNEEQVEGTYTVPINQDTSMWSVDAAGENYIVSLTFKPAKSNAFESVTYQFTYIFSMTSGG